MKFSQLQILTFGKEVKLLGHTFIREKTGDKWKYCFMKDIDAGEESDIDLTTARHPEGVRVWFKQDNVDIQFVAKASDDIEASIKKHKDEKGILTDHE